MNIMKNVDSVFRIDKQASSGVTLRGFVHIVLRIAAINGIQNLSILPEVFLSYYIISFSSCKDNFSMWSMYAANGNGCALIFDYNELTEGYEIMVKCTYGKDNIEQQFNNFCNLIQTGRFTSFASKLSKED